MHRLQSGLTTYTISTGRPRPDPGLIAHPSLSTPGSARMLCLFLASIAAWLPLTPSKSQMQGARIGASIMRGACRTAPCQKMLKERNHIILFPVETFNFAAPFYRSHVTEALITPAFPCHGQHESEALAF